MSLARARRGRRKGIVGIEAAIVMIAFVIVAAALAFVALNMGMFTTQKSKETIGRGLSQASTALEIDGSVTGNVTSSTVDALVVPLKVAPGREGVDLSVDRTSVRLIITSPDGSSVAYENIYLGVEILTTTPASLSNILSLLTTGSPSNTTIPEAKIVVLKGDNDNVLEFGEKAVLAVELPAGYGSYTKIAIELRVPDGAPLTVERIVPASLPNDGAVDMS
ncbi:MAG: flagellin [Desulfurococcales archaeon]|nr:flagellin [Desulfurococcales archaeon]